MPVQPTYPGVYIEEIASGVRTITGVATSITAFVGRARSGPVEEPVTLNSYGDFERIFGGLWADSSLGYAVRDFYLNGGSQAIVVRLYRAAAGPPTPVTTAELAVGGLNLQAASPGSWGNQLQALVDHDVAGGDPTLFNLSVRNGATGGPGGRPRCSATCRSMRRARAGSTRCWRPDRAWRGPSSPCRARCRERRRPGSPSRPPTRPATAIPCRMATSTPRRPRSRGSSPSTTPTCSISSAFPPTAPATSPRR